MLGRRLLACGLGISAGVLLEDRRSTRASPNDRLCDPDFDLLLSPESLTYSNLGSAGPDVGRPRGMLFSDILKKVGLNVDMVITARLPYYAQNVSTNRVKGEFLGIGVDDGATATLRIDFIDPRSNTPVKIPRVTFTLAELTAPTEGGGAKSVNVSGVHSYRLHPRTTVTASSHDRILSFTGTSSAPEIPPLFSKDMDTEALGKAVSLQFRNVDSIDMNLTAAPGNASRVFYIGGLSNMVCPTQARCDTLSCPAYYSLKPEPDEIYCAGPACNVDDYTTCCDPTVPLLCKRESLLTFPHKSLKYSNLGGLGPDFGSPPNILYSNVFPGSGSKVDLLVSNRSEYFPADSAANDLHGPRARISVAAGSSVDVHFELVDRSENNYSFNDNGFYFTLYDLDKEAEGNGVEIVRASGFSGYMLANETLIKAREDADGRSVFQATEYTHAMRAEKSNLDVNRIDVSKLVSFEYPPGSKSFDITLSVSHGQEPHAFLFTGYSTLPCPKQDTCKAYECPDNMRHKPGRNSILCAASECSVADATICCQLAEPPAHPATCDTFSCPGESRIKPFAQNLNCRWEECTAEDMETCCIIYEEDACSPQLQLVLNKVAYSNLGGAGPDIDEPEAILYEDVFPGNEKKIDLRVTAGSSESYASIANSTENGLIGALASISVPVGETVLLHFNFLEQGTARQVEHLWPYIMTFVRLDAGSPGRAHQGVSFPDGVTKFSVTDFSRIDVSGDESHPSFVASRRQHNQIDDIDHMALHPHALTPGDEDSSVLVMMNKTQFQMEMSISTFRNTNRQWTGNASRTFLFAGASSMTCSQMTVCSSYMCPAGYTHKESAPWTVCQGEICTDVDLHTCCDCDDVDALKFSTDSLVSSTFGKGLSGTALLSDVFPNSGNNVTLEVSTVGEYYANNGTVTGMNGEFLSVNMRSGSEVTLKFSFSLPSGEPYVAPSFFFSVFDLDRQQDGGAIETVRVTNIDFHRLTEPSAVVYNNDMDAFAGTVMGTDFDNPSNPMALTENHLRHSVSFFMKDRISEFFVTASVTSGWSGRNILFAGSSNVVCPERALCTRASCPTGMQLSENAARMVCKHDVCLEEDVPTCCVDANSP